MLEVARLRVRREAEGEFEAAFAEAHSLLQAADGHLWSELAREVEGGDYLLLVRWRAIEDHVQGFVTSDDFTRFRELLWPHFVEDPTVDHFQEPAGATA
ncbi:MAG: antibiotic biosynthesis monooxygenase [Microbacteriaceae bacterium]|nr:antibiotic biosynthesis monooxygenase [Microbacteriaceae bacterium]